MQFQEIFEGRDAPLYHGTGVANALSALKEDQLRAATYHDKYRLEVQKDDGLINMKKGSGVSLTRNKKFAFEYSSGVVFEIDQRKLAQTNKIIPFAYWEAGSPRDKDITTRRSLGGYEFEEFCVGPIKPLSKYLIHILISYLQYNRLNQYISSTSALYNHPLLKVIKREW